MMFSARDEYWMRQALRLAAQAATQGEVPIGAVLVHQDTLIGQGFNAPITLHDPSAHAEIRALRQGAAALGNYRLINTTLYTTLEPCLMCAGALVHARIAQLIFGAADAKAGAVVSQIRLLEKPFLNHRVNQAGGLLALECGAILSQFFQEKR